MTKAEREKHYQREVFISRLKLFLIVVCLIAIPVTFLVNHSDVGSVKERVAKVESPCLKATEEPTPKNKKLCRESFEKAVLTITHPQACAIERKAGTLRAIRELAARLEVTFTEPCAGARLAQERQRGSERTATARSDRTDSGRQGPSSLSGGSGGAPEPEQGGDSEPPQAPKPHGPRHHSPPAPPTSGSQGTAAPQGPTSSVLQPPPAAVVNPAGKELPPQAQPPGLLPPTVEAAGGVVQGAGEAVNGAGHVVGGAACGLSNSLLCPQH